MMPRLSQSFTLVVAMPLLALAIGCGEDKPEVKSRETINKTTQEVRNLKPELAKGGQVTDGKIHSTDYITIQADAYRTSVANIAKMKVKMDMDQYDLTPLARPVLERALRRYAEWVGEEAETRCG